MNLDVSHPRIMADIIATESKIYGLSVFAARDFEEGETILVIDDSRIVDDEHPLRPELGVFEDHCDYLADGKVMLMQSPECHINLSCDPSTYAKIIDVIRHVLTRRLIKSGEEITCACIIHCHGGEVWECTCGRDRCRRYIPFQLLRSSARGAAWVSAVAGRLVHQRT